MQTRDFKQWILYEDNHLLVVNKPVSVIVQGDKTGDRSLIDMAKAYIKARDNKPGNVFIGLPHRLDRPVSGIVLLSKTGKALSRLAQMFQQKTIHKTYWAVVKNSLPKEQGQLRHYLQKNQKQNKSYASDTPRQAAKEAVLNYRLLAGSDNFHLVEIDLQTGRHHQIRCQLAHIACPIKGDLKYGFPRSNPDGGIHLHARQVDFVHPVKKEALTITAPPPDDVLWKHFLAVVES